MPAYVSSLAYLVSGVCFILALKALSSPSSASRGNIIGIIGMVIAVVTACTSSLEASKTVILVIGLGGIIGAFIARSLPMTSMPQMVAGFHSFVGLAATLVGFVAFKMPELFNIGDSSNIPKSALVEMALGITIGTITFTGSLVAFAKLQGLMKSAPLKFPGQQYLSIALTLFLILLIIRFVGNSCIYTLSLLTIISGLIGILIIAAVGGGDMPVVVSMLNSYSGWAASGVGFTLNNSLLIITGALVGSSGAILSYVMCKAMNRSIINVIFSAFMQTQADASANDQQDKNLKVSNAEEAAYLLKNSGLVVIVPGYGMAVAQSQHAIKEMTELLEAANVEVKFAIHPVAGRMPGHMNVLLAEAGIDYEKVYELEDINREFPSVDITLVIGANDITNPAAKNDPQSPIFGMPILEVDKSKTVLFVKRSMAAGYAGIENSLFYNDNTLMLFGDAKKVVEEVIKHLNEN